MNAGGVRKDLGAVMYAANVLGSRGPRKMQVITCAYKYWVQSDRLAHRLSDTLTDRQTYIQIFWGTNKHDIYLS